MCCRASDKCQREKRKTVNGDDLLWAMKSLGFEDSVVVLGTYLQKIREVLHFACAHHAHSIPESYAFCHFTSIQRALSATLLFSGGGSGEACQDRGKRCRGG